MTKPEDRDIRGSLDTRMLAYAISSGGVEGCQELGASFPTRVLQQEGRMAHGLAGLGQYHKPQKLRRREAQHRVGMSGTWPFRRSIGHNADGLGADKLCCFLQS